MVTNFFISQDGFFRGNGLIPYLTKNLQNSDVNFQSVFEEVIHDIKKVHNVYVLSMSDDGKITGRERIQLCKEIDLLIGDLILLRITLNENKEIFSLDIRKYSLYITFKINKARWEGFGNMGTIHSLRTKSIKDWIKQYYSIKIKRLVSYTSSAIKKNSKLEPHEAILISTCIEKLILALVVARNDIYSAKLS